MEGEKEEEQRGRWKLFVKSVTLDWDIAHFIGYLQSPYSGRVKSSRHPLLLGVFTVSLEYSRPCFKSKASQQKESASVVKPRAPDNCLSISSSTRKLEDSKHPSSSEPWLVRKTTREQRKGVY